MIGLVLLLVANSVLAQQSGDIDVTVTGIKSDDGQVLVALFNGKDGFPGESDKAFARYKASIKNGVARFRIADVPYGIYAIALVHDENSNGKMDRNFLGIPKEGFGASNDPKALFGPPSYDDSTFTLQQEKMKLTIKMKYL
jgi:uncharacterized protein (DUF2141 family)